MATNRERLEHLETSVQDIQTSIQQLLEKGPEHQNPWGRGRKCSPNPSDESEGESSDGSQASNTSKKSHASNKVIETKSGRRLEWIFRDSHARNLGRG